VILTLLFYGLQGVALPRCTLLRAGDALTWFVGFSPYRPVAIMRPRLLRAITLLGPIWFVAGHERSVWGRLAAVCLASDRGEALYPTSAILAASRSGWLGSATGIQLVWSSTSSDRARWCLD